MKRAMAWITAGLMLLALIPCSGGEELSALDAFGILADTVENSNQPDDIAEEILERVMAGAFAPTKNDADAELLAAELPKLSGVTAADVTAYASRHGLRTAQVRNLYYKALAAALSAEIRVHPASGEKYRGAQEILALFLEMEETEESSMKRNELRGNITSEERREMADALNLPESFISFLIMNEQWNDEDWRNDEDWMVSVPMGESAPDNDITVGSRDADGSTLIADMQERLIALGYLQGKANGVFSLRTQRALLEYQAANGLKTNGIYDKLVYNQLINGNNVARWEYQHNFWDTDDMSDSGDTPYTPDTPDMPDTPDSPDTTEKPDTPDSPDPTEKPDTPDSPDTPDTPKPTKMPKPTENPDTPDTPDTPDSPDPTEKPDTPDSPDTPDTPKPTKKPKPTEKPDTPDTPDTPDSPDPTEKPDMPDSPDTPDTPKPTKKPKPTEKPDTPDTPDTPDSPDPTEKPDTPDSPDTPDGPDTPEGTKA